MASFTGPEPEISGDSHRFWKGARRSSSGVLVRWAEPLASPRRVPDRPPADDPSDGAGQRSQSDDHLTWEGGTDGVERRRCPPPNGGLCSMSACAPVRQPSDPTGATDPTVSGGHGPRRRPVRLGSSRLDACGRGGRHRVGGGRPHVYGGGGVIGFGDAQPINPIPGAALNSVMVAMATDPASTAANQGYWLASADGGVFAGRKRRLLRIAGRAPAAGSDRGHGGHRRRPGLLAGGHGRRGLRLRGRPLLRLDGRHPAEPAHRGDGLDPRRPGLLAGGRRRRHLLLRRRPVLRLDGRAPRWWRRSPAWRRPRTATATGWWPPTAASSPSATPRSTGRAGEWPSTIRWWGWLPPRTTRATCWWPPNGAVLSFGSVNYFGSLGGGYGGVPSDVPPVAGIALTPDTQGYWLLEPDGWSYSFSNPPNPSASPTASAIVSVANSQVNSDPDRGRYCNPYGPCEEWCALFATWVWETAGVPIPSYPVHREHLRLGRGHHAGAPVRPPRRSPATPCSTGPDPGRRPPRSTWAW